MIEMIKKLLTCFLSVPSKVSENWIINTEQFATTSRITS